MDVVEQVSVVSSNENGKVSLLHLTPYTDYKETADRPVEGTGGSSHRPGPFCFLLEIDSAKILLDVGAVQRETTLGFDHLHPLKKILKEVDAILCTHAHVDHVGGLPFLYGKLGASCPVYMTLATSMMTQIVLGDTLFGTSPEFFQEAEPVSENLASENPIQASHAKAALSKIIGLRYSQPVSLHGKAEGISITAFPAGHSLGGCYWRIRKGNEDIIYAVRINHKKERHLDGTQLLQLTGRPSVFITDATAALTISQNRKTRDGELIDLVISHLRHVQGSVLMPVDPAGRILELLLLLDSAWTLHRVPYPIYLVGPESSRLLEYVRSMLEWMGESVIKSFGANRENPFELKHIKAMATVEALHAAIETSKATSSAILPKVVLATSASLSYGASRRLFYEWASLPDHLVLFTTSPYTAPSESLAGQLAKFADAKGKPNIAPFKVPIRTALEGQALQQYHLKRKKAIEPSVVSSSRALFSSDKAEELVVDYGDDEEDEETTEVLRMVEKPSQALSKETFTSSATSSSNAVSTRAATTPSYQDPSLWSWNQSWSFDYVMRQPLPFLSCLPKALKMPGLPMHSILFPIAGSESRKVMTPYGEPLRPEDWPAFKFEDVDEKAAVGAEKPKESDSTLLSGELKEALDYLKILSTNEKENEAMSSLRLRTDTPSSLLSPTAEKSSLPVVRTEWHVFQGSINCTIKWIDMDGVCDGRSLKTIINQIQPRKLVLVHGDESSIQYLYQSTRLSRPSASQETTQSTLICLYHLERLNISILSNMYQLKLSDSLLSSLQLIKKNDYTLARLHGTIKLPTAEEDVPFIDLPAQHEKSVSSLLYQYYESLSSSSSETQGPQKKETGESKSEEEAKKRTSVASSLVGEARLPELRRKFQKLGYSAEFCEGKLIVDRSVALYKPPHGEIWIEGPISKSYYDIRQILYQQFVRL